MKRILSVITLAILAVAAFAQTRDEVHHILTSDSVDLYVHVKGEGEPCLYLHGGPGSGSTWMEIMGGKELEERYAMVYLDQRGVCKSSSPKDNNYTLSRQTLDFEEVRKALGLEHWYLLGHSFGGILEIAYWHDYPKSISGMIFEDCTLSMRDSFRESWLPAAIDIVGKDADPVAKDEAADLMLRMSAIQKQLNNDTRALIFTTEENKHVSDTLNSWSFHKECISHNGEKVMELEEYWQTSGHWLLLSLCQFCFSWASMTVPSVQTHTKPCISLMQLYERVTVGISLSSKVHKNGSLHWMTFRRELISCSKRNNVN